MLLSLTVATAGSSCLLKRGLVVTGETCGSLWEQGSLEGMCRANLSHKLSRYHSSASIAPTTAQSGSQDQAALDTAGAPCMKGV